MKPVLFLSPHISSYPVLMLFGFLFGWLLVRKRAPLYGISANHLDNICLILPVSGLLGARYFARLFYAKVSWVEALKVWEGDGLVFYGGFLFSVAVVLAYGFARKLNLAALCNCAAPGVALGLAFGRIGCFLAGCCWGDLCVEPAQLVSVRDQTVIARIHTIPEISGAGWPFKVRFPQGSDPFNQHVKFGLVSQEAADSVAVHPVQLYEAALAMALTVFLARKRMGDHAAMGLFVGYAVIRFGTEFLRADNKPYAWGLTFSQVLSIEILLGAVAFLALKAFWQRADQATAVPYRSHQASDRICTRPS